MFIITHCELISANNNINFGMQEDTNKELPQSDEPKSEENHFSSGKISSYQYLQGQSTKLFSESNIPISYNQDNKQFLSQNYISSSQDVSQDQSVQISKEEMQRRRKLFYQHAMAKIEKTMGDLQRYLGKLTENSTQVLVIQNPIHQQLQQIIQIWISRAIKKPNYLMRLSLESEALSQEHIDSIWKDFESFPSILLTINGKVYQNNRPIYMQKDIYYEGDDQFMHCHSQQNHQTYMGQFKDKKYHGKGQLINRSNKFGFIYIGEFQNGKFQGKGQIKQANFVTYAGDFKNDRKHGIGIQTTHVSKRKKNQPNAKPIMVKTSVYQGQFEFGDKHGEGIQEKINEYIYNGFWVAGNKSGKGKIKFFKNGYEYQGDFQNNLYSGKGKFIEKDNCQYEGDFLDGKYHGKGKIIYKNEDFYQGDFQFGKKHGQGVYTWADGDYYDGSWINDSAQGHGTSMMGSDFYDGQYQNGVRHGQGSLTDGQGDTIRAIWQDGKMIRILERNGQIVEE